MADALRRVFISYARADSTDFVDLLEQDLKAQQFHPWVDRHGLEGGEEWMESIQQAIDECHALIVVLSPAAVQSKFVRMEYRYASEIGKLVIPVRYLATTTTPMDLHILQWVDFQTSYDTGLHLLAQALSRIKAPAFMPAPAMSTKTKEQWLDEGNEHITFGRYTEALAAFDQAIQIDPQYAPAYAGRGEILKNLQRIPEALAAYDQAIQLSPRYAFAYYGRGESLRCLSRFTEALAAFDQAIQLDPRNAFAYGGRGEALRGVQRYTEALAAYDQGLQFDPHYAFAYYGKGNVLQELGRYEEALAAYNQAIQLNPQLAMAYNTKAIALDALGRKQEAEQARQKARELGYTG